MVLKKKQHIKDGSGVLIHSQMKVDTVAAPDDIITTQSNHFKMIEIMVDNNLRSETSFIQIMESK